MALTNCVHCVCLWPSDCSYTCHLECQGLVQLDCNQLDRQTENVSATTSQGPIATNPQETVSYCFFTHHDSAPPHGYLAVLLNGILLMKRSVVFQRFHDVMVETELHVSWEVALLGYISIRSAACLMLDCVLQWQGV